MFFSQKTRFDISYKSSPVETICTKCQILFSVKNKKKYFNMLSADNFAQSAKHQSNMLYEPQLEKPYLLTCAPNKDSGHPAHMCSLISLFFHMKKLHHNILGYQKCAQQRFRSACALVHMSEGIFLAHLS